VKNKNKNEKKKFQITLREEILAGISFGGLPILTFLLNWAGTYFGGF